MSVANHPQFEAGWLVPGGDPRGQYAYGIARRSDGGGIGRDRRGQSPPSLRRAARCRCAVARAGLALPVVDADEITVTYENLFRLLADLRGMGETNTVRERVRTATRRNIFLRPPNSLIFERYPAEDGRIRATFEIIFLHGWAPHESQQKALRPGSAKTSLADALGTAEYSAGDSAGPDRSDVD